MDDNVVTAGFFGKENLLLALGVGLAVVFLGLLAFDLIRRRRARRRRRREPAPLREKLLKPVHRLRAFRSELEQILGDRSRQRGRSRSRPAEPHR
jgi:uncharacterized iron-regulated membrane protein